MDVIVIMLKLCRQLLNYVYEYDEEYCFRIFYLLCYMVLVLDFSIHFDVLKFTPHSVLWVR